MYRRALDRLRELPEVFTLNTAASILGCEANMASTYITRWKEQGLVSSLGPRTGVHFNLRRNENAPAERWPDAVATLFPGAVIGGASALLQAGWTTQIPRRTEVMIPARRTWPAIEGADIRTRPRAWFRRAETIDDGPLPHLAPAFALADSVASGDWVPDPDDIEWDEVTPRALLAAFEALGARIPEDWDEELADLLGPDDDDPSP